MTDLPRGQSVSVQPWFLSVSERDERAGRVAALLRAGQAGDRAALEELLGAYERPLLAFCRGILGHREDIAAQEERCMYLACALRRPRVRLVVVTCLPVRDEVVEYYLGLIPAAQRMRAPVFTF